MRPPPRENRILPSHGSRRHPIALLDGPIDPGSGAAMAGAPSESQSRKDSVEFRYGCSPQNPRPIFPNSTTATCASHSGTLCPSPPWRWIAAAAPNPARSSGDCESWVTEVLQLGVKALRVAICFALAVVPAAFT